MGLFRSGAGPAALDAGLKPPRKKRRLVLRVILAIALWYLLVPPFVRPAKGSISSGFFFRVAPEARIFPELEFHSGIDIAAPSGSPVVASKGGEVVYAGYGAGGGNQVVIRHWLGFETYYAHLSRIDVAPGQYVWKWQKIGEVGSTGRSTGPHLHFETRFLGIKIPPEIVLLIDEVRSLAIPR
jgi:murein DD-endopeptidase MepM/ murein hydrolase activator NlpD